MPYDSEHNDSEDFNIMWVLQEHDYDHWINVAAFDHADVTLEELFPHAVASVTQKKFYNTSAKRFALNLVDYNPRYQYRLSFQMKNRANDIGDYSRLHQVFRVIEVDADSESVKVGDSPVAYPPYVKTNTSETMDKWINNEALTPELHLARCLACVFDSRYGHSGNAFGLYCQDNLYEYETPLNEAKRFIGLYGEQQAIDMVNFHMETYQREITFRQMFGDFRVRM